MRKLIYYILVMAVWLPLVSRAQTAPDAPQPPEVGGENTSADASGPGRPSSRYKAEELIAEMDRRFVELDTLIFGDGTADAPRRVPTGGAYRAPLVDATAVTAREQALDAAIARRVDAEIAEYKSDLGVQLTGQTYYRLDGVVGSDDEDPVSSYNGKMQIEARWYILQSSLYNRQGNIRALQLQGDIDRTIQQRDRLDQSVYQQKEYFRQVSDSLLSGVLQQRIANLALLTDANLYLLQHGDVSSDELLRVLDAKAEAERTLATLIPGAPAATDLSGIEAYTVTVDTTALMRHIEETAVDMRLLRLRLELLEQQERNTTYWDDCRVAPFVRYSYYQRSYAPNSSNVDAGLSFTIPINTTAAHHRRTLAAQRQVLEAEGIDVLRQVTDRVRYYATEIGRLNRACEGEIRRIDELKGYLSIRAYAYDNRAGQYNRLSRLKEYNNYLVCLERLITCQYQRDCYVADLQRLLNYGSILDYCTIHAVQADPANRTLSTP